MRLLLDVHLSPRRIGEPLSAAGHDVVALALDPVLSALDDADVMTLAAESKRLLVTRNSRDFSPLIRQWAEAQRPHSGCILIWSLDHAAFARIVEGVLHILEQRPDQAEWIDLTVSL